MKAKLYLLNKKISSRFSNPQKDDEEENAWLSFQNTTLTAILPELG